MDWVTLVGILLGSTVAAAALNVLYKVWSDRRWSTRAREVLELREMLDVEDSAARQRLLNLAHCLISCGAESEMASINPRTHEKSVLHRLDGPASLVLTCQTVSFLLLSVYAAFQMVLSDKPENANHNVFDSDPILFVLVSVFAVSSLIESAFRMEPTVRAFTSFLGRRLPRKRTGDAPDPGEQGEKVDGGGE